MNSAVKALIKKDLRAVTDDRRMFSALLILPLIMTVLLPAVFVLIICMGSDSGDVRELLELLPSAVSGKTYGRGFKHRVKLYHTGVFSDDPDHDIICYGRRFLCRRKRKAYSRNAPLLPSFPEQYIPCQSRGLLFSEYADFFYFFCRHDRHRMGAFSCSGRIFPRPQL